MARILVEYKYSRTVGLQYLSCYVALILVLLTVVYIIITMHVFSMNTAGGDSSRYSCKVYYIWRPRLPIRPSDERPPAMYGHFCMVPRVSVHDRYYCILYCYFFVLGTHDSVDCWSAHRSPAARDSFRRVHH